MPKPVGYVGATLSSLVEDEVFSVREDEDLHLNERVEARRFSLSAKDVIVLLEEKEGYRAGCL